MGIFDTLVCGVLLVGAPLVAVRWIGFVWAKIKDETDGSDV
jgi:hypothetical protein